MSLWLWSIAAILLFGIGGIAVVRGSTRVGSWLMLSCAGLGLCGLFLSLAGLREDPVWTARWVRLLWCTAVLSIVPLLLFSYRFGRPRGSSAPRTRRLMVFLTIAAAAILIGMGLRQPPLGVVHLDAVGAVFILKPPVGRPLALFLLAGLAIVLLNLQATLEAARSASSKRTERSIYALAPVIVVAIYLIADLLLYAQQRFPKTDMLLPATLLSSIAFGSVMGVRRVGDVALPVGRPIVYSSVVLTALGLLLVGLALLSQLFRALGVSWQATWFEQIAVSILLLGFLLSAFPGLRSDMRRFLDRNIFVSRFDYRHLWEQANRAFAGIDSLDGLTPSLRDLLRNSVGPIRLQIWIASPQAGGALAPLSDATLPILDDRHPLRHAMEQTGRPLILEQAHRLEEIPLQIACEGIAKSHGLTIYLPVRAAGALVGVLGLGSTAGRILHPEDIDVAQTLADQLGGFLGARSSTARKREKETRGTAEAREEGSDAATPGTIRPSV